MVVSRGCTSEHHRFRCLPVPLELDVRCIHVLSKAFHQLVHHRFDFVGSLALGRGTRFDQHCLACWGFDAQSGAF